MTFLQKYDSLHPTNPGNRGSLYRRLCVALIEHARAIEGETEVDPVRRRFAQRILVNPLLWMERIGLVLSGSQVIRENGDAASDAQLLDAVAPVVQVFGQEFLIDTHRY